METYRNVMHNVPKCSWLHEGTSEMIGNVPCAADIATELLTLRSLYLVMLWQTATSSSSMVVVVAITEIILL